MHAVRPMSTTSPNFARSVNSWAEWVKRIREDGLLFTVSNVLHRSIPESLFHARKFLIFAGRLARDLPGSSATTYVRRATFDDVDVLSKCGYPPSVLRHWLIRGAHGWLIDREGELLACYWLDGNDRYNLYDWLVIKASSKDVWVLWWWVARKYRGQIFAYKVRIPGRIEYANAGFSQILGNHDCPVML